jgi:hypothetical protein
VLSGLHAKQLSPGEDFHHHVAKIVSAVRKLSVSGADRRFWDEIASKHVRHTPPAKGFDITFFSADVQYQCRTCGFTHWIEKLEWFRDGERPPAKCPQCGADGHRG